jgi:hypothetical protein
VLPRALKQHGYAENSLTTGCANRGDERDSRGSAASVFAIVIDLIVRALPSAFRFPGPALASIL